MSTSPSLQTEQETRQPGEIASMSKEGLGRQPVQPQKRPSKRRKTSETNARVRKLVRVRGRLANLPKMPLDILFEIFGLLLPLDLLHLTRTSKDLRATLMNRSALTVWKGARANVPGLPDCPEGISEPSYANFMFTSNCYVCLAPRASFSLAPHFVRYCKGCADHELLWSPLPAALQEQLRELPELIEPFTYTLSRKAGQPRWACFRSDFMKLYKGYVQVKDDDDGAQEKFMTAHLEMVEVMSEWEKTYSQWTSSRQEARLMELQQNRVQRANAIREKLTQAGWGETLESMSWKEACEFEEHPAVKQPKLLTDRIWKNMEPEMISLMHQFRQNQVKRKRAATVRTRRRLFAQVIGEYALTHPVDAVLPTSADFYYMDDGRPIREMIEDGPDDMEFAKPDLDEFVAMLPRLCDEWKAACTTFLLEVYSRDSPSTTEVTEDMLKLATSTFACSQCRQNTWYPQVLNHICFSKGFLFPGQFLDKDLLGVAEDLESSEWLSLAKLHLTWDPTCTPLTAIIVEAFELDPDTATQAELDDLPKLIVRKFAGDNTVMDWRRAMKLISLTGWGAWFTVDEEDFADLWESDELGYYLYDTETLCVCKHCREWVISPYLGDHMLIHKPDEPLAREDIWVHPDNPLTSTFSITIPGFF